MNQVLSEILATDQRHPGAISVQTLFFWLKDYYVRDGVPIALKGQFLEVLVNRAVLNQNASDQTEISFTYDLLGATLSDIQISVPKMYEQAPAVLNTLLVRLSKENRERPEIDKRIAESSDPLDQTIVEANNASDSLLKDELLTDAAQRALAAHRLKLAVDLASSTSTEGNHGLWRDQFLVAIADQTLKNGDIPLTDSILDRLKSPLRQSESNR